MCILNPVLFQTQQETQRWEIPRENLTRRYLDSQTCRSILVPARIPIAKFEIHLVDRWSVIWSPRCRELARKWLRRRGHRQIIIIQRFQHLQDSNLSFSTANLFFFWRSFKPKIHAHVGVSSGLSIFSVAADAIRQGSGLRFIRNAYISFSQSHLGFHHYLMNV